MTSRSLFEQIARRITGRDYQESLAQTNAEVNDALSRIGQEVGEALAQIRMQIDETRPAPPDHRALIQGLADLSGQIQGLSQAMDSHMREVRLLLRHAQIPHPDTWRLEAGVRALPGVIVFDRSRPCRELDFVQPYFAYWSDRIGAHLSYHRKLWEFVYICQSLHEYGFLRQGSRGLGFGVGAEPLPALFAALGCEITATDLMSEAASEKGWIATDQHADSLDSMRRPEICPDALFDQRVSFRPCDMNHVPNDLVGFDFCWSACALEHLGSIEKGLAFIERSLDCLKPGGMAVHTTEFNVFSNTDTVDNQDTVLFRQCDFEALFERVTAAGHEMLPLDFHVGTGQLDRYVDTPPFLHQPHLKMALAGHATTSFGVIIRKRA